MAPKAPDYYGIAEVLVELYLFTFGEDQFVPVETEHVAEVIKEIFPPGELDYLMSSELGRGILLGKTLAILEWKAFND